MTTTIEMEVSRFSQRRGDWRNGAITYQVFVDRFVPAQDLDAKRVHYQTPRRLREWSELPSHGEYNKDAQLWCHELDFWGGDLTSLTTKVDYLKDLGIQVLYLNPIIKALSNHKYDAEDYFAIAPEYGDFDDLQRLTQRLAESDMKLVLDGVFNHVSIKSDWFQQAQNNPTSPYRDWFTFTNQTDYGHVGWWGVENLPELNWNCDEVTKVIASNHDSVIRKYFNYGISGWRLDVASDLGFDNLRQITDAAHEEKADALVIGEAWNYPTQWLQAMDAVMNFSLRQIMLLVVQGTISVEQFITQLNHMIEDCGIEPLLKSWLVIDNHDTERLQNLLPDQNQQQLMQILQFTLPGAPCIYYGVELGMSGGEEPGCRGPMQWDLLSEDNPHYQWMKKLVAIRQSSAAFSIGDYLPLATEHVLAYLRLTDDVSETRLVVINLSSTAVSETLLVRDSRLMNRELFIDQLTGDRFDSHSGILSLTVPARSALILKPTLWQEQQKIDGYTPYKY